MDMHPLVARLLLVGDEMKEIVHISPTKEADRTRQIFGKESQPRALPLTMLPRIASDKSAPPTGLF
jgi:hypothetical protein